MIEGVSPDLPHTADLPPAMEWGLRVAKPLVAAGLRTWWTVRVHDPHHVPRRGPVILAANHIGMLDGPALVALTRRLTFALAKHELFTGVGGAVLAHVGQISLNRQQLDVGAIRRATSVLRAGKVLAVFPEGVRTGGEVAFARGGAAYLAMVSGAPIVPVAVLGTREPGQTREQVPRRRGPIHLVYGPALRVPQAPWPRRKTEVGRWTEVLRSHLAAHVRTAERVTGLALPGPPAPRPGRIVPGPPAPRPATGAPEPQHPAEEAS